MKEKTLSDKKFKSNVHKDLDWYNEEDVKQFIKEVLEEINKLAIGNTYLARDGSKFTGEKLFVSVDKLKYFIKQKAGDNLI